MEAESLFIRVRDTRETTTAGQRGFLAFYYLMTARERVYSRYIGTLRLSGGTRDESYP